MILRLMGLRFKNLNTQPTQQHFLPVLLTDEGSINRCRRHNGVPDVVAKLLGRGDIASSTLAVYLTGCVAASKVGWTRVAFQGGGETFCSKLLFRWLAKYKGRMRPKIFQPYRVYYTDTELFGCYQHATIRCWRCTEM